VKDIISSKERVVTALNRKEPDRVPVGELVIDNKVIKGFNKNYKDVVDLAFGEGVDLVGEIAKYKVIKKLPDNQYIDEWGCLYKISKDVVDHPIKGPITDKDDLKKIEFPDSNLAHRFGKLRNFVKKAKGKIAINFHCRLDFMWAVFLMGMDNLMISMIDKPDFIHELLKKIADNNIKMIRNAINIGANTISLGDDYCGKDGPLISPKMFREFLLPNLKRAVSIIHQDGAFCIKHTDGNIWTIMDQLVEAGIDCINPIDPLGRMDVGEVKKAFGNKISIMGNIDCVYTLCKGTKDEVYDAVKTCISKGARNGGLIVSSSNSIHSGVKPANYSYMIKSVHRYGKYPLNITNN